MYIILCTRRLQPTRDDCTVRVQCLSSVKLHNQTRTKHKIHIKKMGATIINEWTRTTQPEREFYLARAESPELTTRKQSNKLTYSKTCVKGPLLKSPKIGFQDQLSLNAGQKYCRTLKWEHSAILLTFIELSFVIKIFVLSIFEWSFYKCFTVLWWNKENGPQLTDN